VKTPKEEKRYICIRQGSGQAPIILENQEALAKSFNSNLRTDADRYYELGPEVVVKTTVQVINAGPVYRGDFNQKE